MPKTIAAVTAERGALHVYREIDMMPGCADRMVALGLGRPQTLADVWRAQSAAYAALSPAERIAEDRETRVALAYLASTCKAGVAPNRPRDLRYTR